jgi:hypothetical protein
MADKIVRARVTRPTFINGVLHQPGEDTTANLTELGVDALGDLTPGLEKHSTKVHEDIVDTPIAAVAPHAPDAPNPQGIGPGTVTSGTGRLVTPAPGGEDMNATAPVGADSEAAQKLEKPAKTKPTKGK